MNEIAPSIARDFPRASASTPVASYAPLNATITAYDRSHLLSYARLIDAVTAGEDWRQVARLVLGLDVDSNPSAAIACFESHLARARWIANEGFQQLIEQLGVE